MAQAEWYYGIAGEQHGPVTREHLRALAEQGRLDRGHMVWREGMAHWVPARSVPGLFDDVPIRLTPVAYAAPADPALRRALRNARANAVAIFSLLILDSILLAGYWNAALRGRGTWLTASVLWGWAGPAVWLSAAYAVVYLAYRWKYLAHVPRTFKTLAWVGGLGLVGLLALQHLLLVLLR